MAELRHPSRHQLPRSLLRSLIVGGGLGALLLGGCGARSAVEVIELGPTAGGARANPPEPSLPAGGGGYFAQGGAPSVAGSPASAGAPVQGGASSVAGAPAQAGAAAQGGAPPEPRCEAVTVAIDELRPAVTLVVDQSLSMRTRYPDDQSPATRWSVVGGALFDPTNGVVKSFESSVRFGIAFFTSRGSICPMLNEVPARTRNYAALNMLYQGLRPYGDTPTGDALQQITDGLVKTPSQAPRSIVLVTDGNPDTCAQPNPDEGQPEAVAAAQRAYEAGIDLYVLGISNDIAGQNLQQLANAGKGRPIDSVWGVDPDAAQPYQASSNVQGLTAQLAEILNRIPLCEVRLQRDVALGEAAAGEVLLDGQALSYSAADGYVLKDARTLEIVGRSCEAIKAGGRQLSVRISCD